MATSYGRDSIVAEMSTVPKMQPGAVWVVPVSSRSANRIVQYTGRNPETGKDGICYKTNTGIRWCSHKAWEEWVHTQESWFVHYSPDDVEVTPPEAPELTESSGFRP